MSRAKPQLGGLVDLTLSSKLINPFNWSINFCLASVGEMQSAG
jgi:hypothetical protein